MGRRSSCNLAAAAGFWLRDSTRYLRYAVRLVTRPEAVALHGVRVAIPPGCVAKRRRSLMTERHERRVALAVVAKLAADDRVVEFGGGLGFIATLCAQRLPAGRVVSVEANPEAEPLIRDTYRRNAVAPTLLTGAVGPGPATARFYVREHAVTSSLVPGEDGVGAVEVRQFGVNELLRELRPTFLIVDIEGAEGPLFEVADLSGVAKLMVELHPGILGRQATERLLARLRRDGFVENRWFSSNRKRFLER